MPGLFAGVFLRFARHGDIDIPPTPISQEAPLSSRAVTESQSDGRYTFLNGASGHDLRTMGAMAQTLRKLGLSLHVGLSVGWLGAIGAFLTLTAATFSRDPALARAAYLMMDVVGRGALLPLSIGALASGIVQSLGTRWGLFRHYWVVVKLLLTSLAVVALFVHQTTAIAEAARLAAEAATPVLASSRLKELGVQLLADSALALSVLLAITLIAVYKPWGLVGHVTRKLRILLAAFTALVVAFVALHLSGHSPHGHSH